MNDDIRLYMDKVGKALERNNMQYFYAKDKQQAKQIVKSLIAKGSSVSNGGSMTLEECGIMQLLRSGDYNFIDREDYPPERRGEVYIKAFSVDTYLCSSNAITEHGELYNVDYNGNRVACLTFGPKQVIVLVGYNKIVKDIPSAIERVKRISAPLNAVRLNRSTYCANTKECLSLKDEDSSMCNGCTSNDRICCSYVVTGWQNVPHKNRIKVVLVGEELGY